MNHVIKIGDYLIRLDIVLPFSSQDTLLDT